MSKNKDIEALHRITGEPYRVCRAKMKANGWDLWNALGLNIFDSLASAIVNATIANTTAFTPVIDAICETVNSIDWEELAKAAADLKRRQDERLIQCTAEHCTEDGCEKCAGYEPMGGWL